MRLIKLFSNRVALFKLLRLTFDGLTRKNLDGQPRVSMLDNACFSGGFEAIELEFVGFNTTPKRNLS